MHHSSSIVTLLVLIFSIGISCQNWRYPKLCHSSDDCGQGECCSIGFLRFSTPVCKPLGELEDWCYEDNEPENRTLHYPNGLSEAYVNIYLNFCPCTGQFVCKQNICTTPS